VDYRVWIVRLYYLNLVLAATYLATRFFPSISPLVLRSLDMDGEANLFSWYSSAMLLVSAICWILQFEFLRNTFERYTAGVTASSLLLLSLDETASFHESASRVMQNKAQGPFEHTGPLFFLAIPVAVLAIVVWRRWPWPGPPALRLFGGAALMVGSACGPEAWANFLIFNSPVYFLEVLIEETGEMMGMTTILLGSYDHLKDRMAERAAVSMAKT